MDWINEETDDLLIEFNKGGTAADIAKALSEKFQKDITRNAVLGKLNRMKLTRQRVVVPSDKPKRLKPRRSRTMVIKPRPPPRLVPRWEVEPPGIFRCTISQLNAERCHWPYGDDPPFMYCGASVAKRGYCYFHYQKSLRLNEYTKPKHMRSKYLD